MADRSPRYAALRLRSYRNLAFVALLLLSLPSIWYLRTDLALYGTGSAALWLRFGARSTLIAAAAGGLPAIRSPVSFDGHSGAVAAAAWGIVASLLALTTLRPPGAGLPLCSPRFTLAVLYEPCRTHSGAGAIPVCSCCKRARIPATGSRATAATGTTGKRSPPTGSVPTASRQRPPVWTPARSRSRVQRPRSHCSCCPGTS